MTSWMYCIYKEKEFEKSVVVVRMLQITNVVVQTDLHNIIDLTHLTNNSRDIRYDPRVFSAAIWKHKKIGGCCLVFRTGKLNCNGNRSVDEARKRIRQYARLIQKHGFGGNLQNIDIITMSAVYQVSSNFDFNKLQGILGATYEPELHNAAMLKRGKIHYNCFHTGKVVITGIKNTDAIYPTLLELELCTKEGHVTC